MIAGIERNIGPGFHRSAQSPAMQREPRKLRWRPGDLVLHDSDPKTHAMLMVVLETRGMLARTAYLEAHIRRRANGASRARDGSGRWYPMGELHDPALFLKTEEFRETLQHKSERRLDSPRAGTRGNDRAPSEN